MPHKFFGLGKKINTTGNKLTMLEKDKVTQESHAKLTQETVRNLDWCLS